MLFKIHWIILDNKPFLSFAEANGLRSRLLSVTRGSTELIKGQSERYAAILVKELTDNIIIGEGIDIRPATDNFELNRKVPRKRKVVRESAPENLDLFKKNSYSLPSIDLLKDNNEINTNNL